MPFVRLMGKIVNTKSKWLTVLALLSGPVSANAALISVTGSDGNLMVNQGGSHGR